MKKFWNWARDETAPDARVLRLEGTIAEESWFDDDVTPALFKDELFSSTGPVTVWINSPGGDCVAAAQIYNCLLYTSIPGDRRALSREFSQNCRPGVSAPKKHKKRARVGTLCQ